MKAKRVIAIVLLVSAGIGLIITLSKQSEPSESLPPTILFAIIGLLLLFKSGKPKKEKNKIKSARLSTATVKHFTGLPIAEGINCIVRHGPNEFTFVSGGNTFNLPNSKITDICIKTESEIQKQYVSSIGGAVGGAVLFGPIGAMIGGRAKEKRTREFTNYLIFTYLKDNQLAYICFEIFGGPELMKIRSWINEFHQEPHAQGVDVEL